MTGHTVVHEFIGRVKTILDDEGPTENGLHHISEELRWLLDRADDVIASAPPPGNYHTQQQAEPIYTDDSGLTLAQARFDPDTFTPIHNHGSWGVVGVYRGRDVLQNWRRLDDGEGPGEAHLELIEERVLGPGDVAIVPNPPQDIHAQKGYGDETAYELVLFGKNVMRMPRIYFDPERNVAEEVHFGD